MAGRWMVLAPTVLLVFAILALAARSALWSPAAPSPAAWTAVSGPHTVIHTLLSAADGTLYAGASRGVYISTDGGSTWQVYGRDFPPIEAWSLALLRDRTLLAAGGDGAIYRLAPSGGRWAVAAATVGTYGVYALSVDPHGTLLAGSDRGIARSTDGGRSWQRVAALATADGSGGVTSFARDPANGALYAGLAGLPAPLRVSRDDGRTWSIPGGPLPPPTIEALLETSDGLYAGVMRATGGLAVWQRIENAFVAQARGLPDGTHGMALAATDRPAGRILVGTMGAGVYTRSHDTPWSRLGPGPGDGVVLALLAVSRTPTVLLAGTDSGIYRLVLPTQR